MHAVLSRPLSILAECLDLLTASVAVSASIRSHHRPQAVDLARLGITDFSVRL
ncbi:hypothetical protein RNZ50_11165 [Paracoccaceae bacterium Fryx2]|nr:hypothetical protein [Paracoccaceae bacterium Fryx2]